MPHRRDTFGLVGGSSVSSESTSWKQGTKRFGYSIAIALNALFLFFVNNVLEWGLFSWLTNDFEQVIPILNFSLGLGIVLNAIYLIGDPPLLKSSTQLISNIVSLLVVVRMYRVYPFDFGAYSFNWDLLMRIMLILGIVGTSIGIISELVKSVRLLSVVDERA